jgi:hypothetical protein
MASAASATPARRHRVRRRRVSVGVGDGVVGDVASAVGNATDNRVFDARSTVMVSTVGHIATQV